jgi:fructokinase
MREYFSLSQKEFPAEQIAAAEEAGEPSAVRSLAMYKHQLARSLAALVNILDPDVIVLGGGISNSSTTKEAMKELAAAESERAARIEHINPRVIS